MQLKIVADAHIWGVEDAFSSFHGYQVNLDVREAATIEPACLQDADVLLSRSSVKINAKLLDESSVRFVGTATVGDDHVDLAFLQDQAIHFASAAGSSTGSVLEYMLAALLYWQQEKKTALSSQVLGIVGVGRIGSALATLADKLGMQVLLCDPPRQRQEKVAGLVSLSNVLQQADILTLHTPLIRQGTDATYHLLNRQTLGTFQGHTLINAARGGVIDQTALCHWLDADVQHQLILDCWEHEPHISKMLLQHDGLMLGTAHIAGHSLDGKAANTYYVYRALCTFLGVEPCWQPVLPQRPHKWLKLHANLNYDAVQHIYPIAEDAQHLLACAQYSKELLAKEFKQLRRYYPVRRSWLK